MPAPSLFYRQHHEVEAPIVDAAAFRQGWRVRTRLDGLILDGAITPAEWRAAVAFRTAAERILAAAWSSPIWLGAPGARGRAHDPIASQLDDLAWLRELCQALGKRDFDLVGLCVVDDVSWADLGRQRKVDPKTARAWTVRAIKALARR
jgi:hypothetical protein